MHGFCYSPLDGFIVLVISMLKIGHMLIVMERSKEGSVAESDARVGLEPSEEEKFEFRSEGW